MSKIAKATHEGIIDINGFKIKSYNLDTGERVLSRIDFLRALGRKGKAKGGRKYDKEFELPVFLTANNLKEFISKELQQNSAPILFKDMKGVESIGYKAELLPSVCYVFIDAFDAGVLQKTQIPIADQCKILVRGFATIGIIALIDEATGFQLVRKQQALQKILEKYLRKEYAAWARCFPYEFYEEMFRLKDWKFDKKTMQMPGVVGRYTNDIVYDRLAPGILEELQKKNPVIDGKRKAKHHQWLTQETGHPALDRHFSGVLALMRANTTWDGFKRLLERAYPKVGTQLALKLFEDTPTE
jgi:hypothetical protein